MAHNTCDTFFVEGDDSSYYQQFSPRQTLKMLNRRKQDLIANELSRLAADEYLEDVMEHVREMEACPNQRAHVPRENKPG